jgi:hypothetical protein
MGWALLQLREAAGKEFDFDNIYAVALGLVTESRAMLTIVGERIQGV